MTSITIRDNEEKMQLPVKNNGNLSVHSLKQYFPKADSLAYKDEEGQMRTLTVSLDEILLDSKIEEYYLHVNEDKSQSTESVKNEEMPNGTNDNEEDNNVSSSDQIDDVKPTDNVTNDQPQNEPKDNVKSSTTEPTAETAAEKSPRPKNQKTIRIGWLHKDPWDKRYSKMKKPQGGVIRLKLDYSTVYSAAHIRRLAVKEFDLVEADYKEVQLGFFDGKPIEDFRFVSAKRRQSALIDDIWEYCRLLSTTPYSLNLFLLTVSKKPKLLDNVRVLYHYARVSKYSGETLHTECDREQLHCYMIEQQFGCGPSIEEFDPLEDGYEISKIEKDGEVLLHVHMDEETKDGGVTKSVKVFCYPSAKVPPEPHTIVHDLDELKGVYCGTVGLGLVTSCTDVCKPVFTWYRDGELYKSAKQLYWLSDVCDGQKHVWKCIVTCEDGEIKSKELQVDGD